VTQRENNPDRHSRELIEAVSHCSDDPRLLAAIRDVYRDVDRIVAENQSVCLGGGACCRFDLFDHRLYATVGELAVLLAADQRHPERLEQNRCPYQSGPRCLAREHRPLGCRVFFCRERPGASESEAYETAHKRIKELHAAGDGAYAYVELISALKILRQFCR